MKKEGWVIVGFLLLMVGFLSIFLSIVGLSLKPLSFLNTWGRGPAFAIHIMMIMAGAIIVYIRKTARYK